MRVSVFGLGYVGCVTAACLAHDGHTVIGVDVNPQKVDWLASGRAPVSEPGLDELVRTAVDQGNLHTTLDGRSATRHTDISMICVGTPSCDNGSLDLRFVKNVCREIGAGLAGRQSYHVVVIRSTVLPGSTQQRLIPLLEGESGLRSGCGFGVCVNPEFLREGSAIEDCNHPSFIAVGELDSRSGDVVQALYETAQAPLARMSIPTAEMLKYANNAFHALKITFANEIGNLCKAQGIDGPEVMDLLCRDRRLNVSAAYLRPGFAFGGSCLPKDLRALLHRAKELDVDCPVLSAAYLSNRAQIQRGIELVERTERNKIGVLGLSFKPCTDDVRESPIVTLVETLVGRGYQVSIYDERVDPGRLIGANKTFLERELPHIASLMRASIGEVLAQSEVVVVANGCPDFRQVASLMREDQVLIDLVGIARNTHDGGRYEGICW